MSLYPFAAVLQQGQAAGLVRPASSAAMILRPLKAAASIGLTGDHSRLGPRNARQTLIQNTWRCSALMGALMKIRFTARLSCAAISPSVALTNSSQHTRFRLGQAILETTGCFQPCASWRTA
jgi:hypothetical protein